MEIGIVETERGPTIIGTRITVYTIVDYLKLGWHHTLIASDLRISSAQVLAAIEYIDDHREEVLTEYERIVERSRQAKNPPEVEAKRKESRRKLLALRERLRIDRALKEAADARNHARQ